MPSDHGLDTPNAANQNDCCATPGTDLLPVNEGLARILSQINPVTGSQRADIRLSLGAILAEDVISPINVPAYNNSAMDGYAIHSRDLTSNGTQRFTVIANVLAGHPFQGTLKPGECVQIMTGAELPAALDTVVIREICHHQGDQLSFDGPVRAGENCRRAGEDLPEGSVAVSAGTRLGAAELGLIASLGVTEVSVQRQPRVAYFSTGDEIRSLGQSLNPGQIYESNRYTVTAMLRHMGLDVIDLGVIPDTRTAIEAAFMNAASQADLIISSGGVSLGDADYVKETLDKVGKVGFWRLAMKPGRPLAFGQVGDAHFFGLPGNPVAVMISFLQFVQPALRKLAGENEWLPLTLTLPSLEALKKRSGRSEFVRGVIETNAGGIGVRTTGQQGSGILASMSQANCLIVLDQEQGNVAVGDAVKVQPFSGLFS